MRREIGHGFGTVLAQYRRAFAVRRKKVGRTDRMGDNANYFAKTWLDKLVPGQKSRVPPGAHVEYGGPKSRLGRLVFVVWPLEQSWKGIGQWGAEWGEDAEGIYFIPSKSEIYEVESRELGAVAMRLWDYFV